MQKAVIRLTCVRLAKGKLPSEIAKDLEEDLSYIEQICEAAKEFAPIYDPKKVYQKLYPTRQ